MTVYTATYKATASGFTETGDLVTASASATAESSKSYNDALLKAIEIAKSVLRRNKKKINII